jgi:hypothetical protein
VKHASSYLIGVVLTAAALFTAQPAFLHQEEPPSFTPAARAAATQPPGDSSVVFIENVGQFADGARFQVRGAGPTFWLAEDALWAVVAEQPRRDPAAEPGQRARPPGLEAMRAPGKAAAVRVTFPGANPHPSLEGFDRVETRVSYLLGNDRAAWQSGAPTWRGVRYRDLFPGVDLELTGAAGGLRARLVADPGMDLSTVSVRLEGGEDVVTPAAGAAHVSPRLGTSAGELLLSGLTMDPTSGAAAGFQAKPLAGSFELTYPVAGAGSAAGVAPQGEPAVVYATFLGGSASDLGEAIAVDSTGAAYVVGTTSSTDFPTSTGAFSTTYSNNLDVFVGKLNPEGSGLVYATFLGGSGEDVSWSIAVDDDGAAYVGGYTASADFPATAGAYDTSYNGNYDAYVAKLNPAGSGLVYATFLGGTGQDYGWRIALDASGAGYVIGETGSADFPTTNGAYGTGYNGGSRDVFVTKLNPAGSGLAYSTFLGGGATDLGIGIAVDSAGSAYACGYTASPTFPVTAGAYDSTYNGWDSVGDAYVSKLNPAGSALVYSTFLGGAVEDWAYSVAVDVAGAAYVTGRTMSIDFPTTPGAYDRTHTLGSFVSFAAKLNPTGSALAYSTYLGGSDWYAGRSIAVDGMGAAYAAGNSSATGTYVVKLNSAGTGVYYTSTVVGGHGIAVDAAGAAYLTGETARAEFPTTAGAYDTTYNGGNDAFVVKLAPTEWRLLYLPVVVRAFASAAR